MEPGYMDKVAASLPEGVDPRLDNRTGSDRPPIESDPAVPQQVDGPDLMHQAEHARAVAELAAQAEQDGPARKGMFSPGGHSLGDESVRGGNDRGLAGGTTVDDSMSTDARTADDVSTVVAPGAFQAEQIAQDAERRNSTDDSDSADAGSAGDGDTSKRRSSSSATETADATPGTARARTAPTARKGTDGKDASK